MMVPVVLTVAAAFVTLAVPASASAPGWSKVPTPNPLAPTGQMFWVSCPVVSPMTARK
jgi:hypothetical protein